ncbi:hypothetical protein GOODEAATRI_011907 [Goodea atripinnis]|uniref:Uridine-cytidine kinase n=1 Tax=Goodea atripinnis TaxID=208336 RepID=A0ABV0MRC6_9TELE
MSCGSDMTLLDCTGARISGCWSLRTDRSGSGEDSLDRLLPHARAPRRKSTTSFSKTEPPLLRTGTRTIYTAGRPPWYDEHGAQSKEAFVIGLCGGSASGKTTVANNIIEALDVPWVVLLSMDSFYKVLSPEEQILAAQNDYNFDHPGAFDFELLVATLQKLKQGKSVKIPVYDFTTHRRQKDWKNVYGASVIIFEGIMSFVDKELLQLLDMKIFVETDSDIRLVRRLRRDITERGRDIGGVIKQYNKYVKPAFEQYIEPTMRLADIVVPRERSWPPSNRLSHCLRLSGCWRTRRRSEACTPSSALCGSDSTGPGIRGPQLQRERSEKCSEIFLLTISLHHTHSISSFPQITGVSILRAGETMEPALRAVCKDVRIGKILIQTNLDSGEPEVAETSTQLLCYSAEHLKMTSTIVL